eukprot:TRINITY_DN19812_c0_g1_i5.p1 TRINITY_DN19812_c0_g1~~TRINITY_DN19812_c0_g1_i5.p1  ORF type:complete len:217 (+),score=37.40 TRINITY_DN19812_c0_g1_i5:297-947(+)
MLLQHGFISSVTFSVMAATYDYGGMEQDEYYDLLNFLQKVIFPGFEKKQNLKNAKDSFRRKAKNFTVDRNGTTLYYVGKNRGGETPLRTVIRKEEVVKVIKNVHDSDHLGVNATHERVKTFHYWNRIYEDVKHYISVCEKCQKSSKFQGESAKLRPVAPPGRPFEMWGMDLTMLPKSEEGYQYLAVAVDYLTKFVEAAPLKSKDAKGILSFLKWSV